MADLNELNEKVEQIKADIREQLEKIENTKGVYEYKKTILDKNGIIGGLMKQMGSVPKEEKADFGKKVNELKNWASEHFDELNTKLKEKEMELRYESEKIDISMPAKSRKTGNLHPVTQVRNQLIDIFASMGFSVYEGTEIETDYYNFTALNTPQDHPARDMKDTFYLSPEFLLRTQTSAGQVHVMESQKPPIKILSPGKVFRSDDDATHSPMFTQMEGLVVDKTITLCDLKGMLEVLVQKIFGEGTTTRLRPSYFTFRKNPEVDAFKQIRGVNKNGWTEAQFEIAGNTIDIAVVSGLQNTRNLMEAIQKREVHYHFVEVMACPGGCVGGGGQPIHEGKELASDRGSNLYFLDKTAHLRFSHENPDIKHLYDEYFGSPGSHKAHQLLHVQK